MPWAESGMVMKETWEEVRALEALLQYASIIALFQTLGVDLQPCPHVNIAAGDLRCANEDMAAVSARTVDADGVLARVSSGGVQRHFTTLVAVPRICGPRSLVPAALEALGDLGDGEGRDRQSEKSSLSVHFCERLS